MAKAKAPKGRSGGKVTNRLVALSSAAVLTVYSAGYMRTRAAADRIQSADRSRPIMPSAPGDSRPITPLPEAPVAAATPAPAASAPRPKKTPKVEASAEPVASPAPAAAPAPADAAPTTITPVAPPTAAIDPAQPTSPVAPQWKDGTYSGWGTSRHGDIEATVVIAGGHITSALITQCWTRYSCSWVAHLQGQVVTRQSPEVDYVTGATQSTNAFYYAVVQALSKAK